jgi:hypothetical protein
LFFFHKRPLLIEFYGAWPQVFHLLIMEALRMSRTGFKQSGDGDLCRFRQSRSRTTTTPFVKMVNNGFGFGFPHVGIEQGRMASLREFFLAAPAAQQTNTILTIDLAHGEIALSWASIMLAIDIATGSSVEVRSLHDLLLGKFV